MPAARDQGIEFRIDYGAPRGGQVIDDDVRFHRRQNGGNACALLLGLPAQYLARVNPPFVSREHGFVEAGDPFFIKGINPGEVTARFGEQPRAAVLGGQRKVHGEAGGRHHRLVFGVVPAEAVDRNVTALRGCTGYAHAPQAECQAAAPVCQRTAVHDSRDLLERVAYVTVAGRVYGQFIEATRHLAPLEQTVPFGVEQVDAPANAVQYGVTRLITVAQIALNAAFDAAAQHFGHQIRNVVRVLFHSHLRLFQFTEQVRCVQHQQPQVAHRNAADMRNARLLLR